MNLVSSDYTNMISCRVTALSDENREETRVIAGVLFGGHQPRITQIDGFRIDAVPDGQLLIVSSRDVPGVIGNYVNIGEYRLGRTHAGDRAMSVVNLDGVVPEYVLKALRDLPEVISVRQMNL